MATSNPTPGPDGDARPSVGLPFNCNGASNTWTIITRIRSGEITATAEVVTLQEHKLEELELTRASHTADLAGYMTYYIPATETGP